MGVWANGHYPVQVVKQTPRGLRPNSKVGTKTLKQEPGGKGQNDKGIWHNSPDANGEHKAPPQTHTDTAHTPLRPRAQLKLHRVNSMVGAHVALWGQRPLPPGTHPPAGEDAPKRVTTKLVFQGGPGASVGEGAGSASYRFL